MCARTRAGSSDDADRQAERELLAEVCRLANNVLADLRRGEAPTAWKARREQVAELRQRIRAMRKRRLSRSWTSSSTTRG
jgi:hypothetical protein